MTQSNEITEQNKEELNVDNSKDKWKIWGIILGIVVLLTILLFFMAVSKTVKQVPTAVNVSKNIIENVEEDVNISFNAYLADIYYYNGKEINLTGFLKRSVKGNSSSGIIFESIVDDYENNIDLLNAYSLIEPIIPDKGMTKEVYQVNGRFKRNYLTLQIQVDSITLSHKDIITKQVSKVVQVSETQMKEVTVSTFPGVHDFFAKIFG